MTEREREALMRLTMCAREECIMCKYHKECDFDFQYELATESMNILADALRKTEPQTCDDCIWSVCNYNKVFDFFRNPTAEERKAVADYIDSISVPTGVNVFDLMDEPQTTSTPYKVDTSSVCKTEPSNSEKPNNCEWSVEYAKEMLDTMSCEECGHWEHGAGDHYYCALLEMRQECYFESKGESTLMFANKPKDEPTISKMEQVEDEPQTDCAWK